MLHQIKRCSAPCVNLVSESEYARLVHDAADFLEGRTVDLQDRLAAEMREASDALAFENAARLRNRIRALASVRASQGINPSTFTEADVFALHQEGGQSCVQVFFFRAGQNWGNRAYFPRHNVEETPADVMLAFLAQFYDEREPPKLVLTNVEPNDHALLQEALCFRAERNIEIRAPQRGEKKDIVDAAALNAREALGRRMAETGSVAKLLDGVAETFALPRPPERIEVYDNSHIQGTNALGAMIVAGPDGFVKNQYRKFNMKAEEFEGDDFAMMRAMIKRRFARMMAEAHPPRAEEPTDGAITDGGVDFSKERESDLPETKFAARPDLVLIDGGEGQLNAALSALDELGLKGKVAIVGIAKGVDRDSGRERFFMPGRQPFRLDEKSPVLYYLQRLRDEAHRFAIGAHRGKRSAGLTRSPLDEIDGIGPARKRALLDRFGSARGVSRAALAELEQVEGVNTELAKRIHDFFHDKK
jgi:excinuclease ABC subunit C